MWRELLTILIWSTSRKSVVCVSVTQTGFSTLSLMKMRCWASHFLNSLAALLSWVSSCMQSCSQWHTWMHTSTHACRHTTYTCMHAHTHQERRLFYPYSHPSNQPSPLLPHLIHLASHPIHSSINHLLTLSLIHPFVHRSKHPWPHFHRQRCSQPSECLQELAARLWHWQWAPPPDATPNSHLQWGADDHPQVWHAGESVGPKLNTSPGTALCEC